MRGRAKKSERGVALITAMLVVALATVAAVAMVSRQQLDIRRTGNILGYDQASLYATGAEAWAGQILRRDQDYKVDHLGEDWATILPPMPIDGGELSGSIQDPQGRFNLNNLVKKEKNTETGEETFVINRVELERFRRLLGVLELDPSLAEMVLDWIDADIDARFPGAEDGAYMGKEVPYRTANRPLASASELLLVEGFTPEIFQRIEPFVTALPGGTTLNVNTIPEDKPELVMSLAEGIGRGDAESVLQARGKEGFPSVKEFLAHPAFAGRVGQGQEQGLSVATNYFMVTTYVSLARMTLTTHSLVERSAEGNTRLIRRYQGNF